MRIILSNRMESMFWISLMLSIYFIATSEFVMSGILSVITAFQFKKSYISSKFHYKTKYNIVQTFLAISYFCIPKQYVILNLQIIKIAKVCRKEGEVLFICLTENGYVQSSVTEYKIAPNLKKAVILLSEFYKQELDKLR